jgi:hypothetical protein
VLLPPLPECDILLVEAEWLLGSGLEAHLGRSTAASRVRLRSVTGKRHPVKGRGVELHYHSLRALVFRLFLHPGPSFVRMEPRWTKKSICEFT